MKPIKSNFKHLDEVGNILTSEASASSILTNLKKNKRSFYQTKSTNFSIEHNKNQSIHSKSPNKKTYQKLNLDTPLKKNESSKKGLKKPIISISTPGKLENKKKEHPIKIKINTLMPTNINMFRHLISGNDYGISENLNWALGLRNHKNELSKEKVSVTQSSNEPNFYAEDLEKYKKKLKKGPEPKIEKLNPNYDKIKHLVLGNKTGNINFSQFSFSTCLRDYNKSESKNNIEKEKKWTMTPLPQIKSDNYVVKYLSPVTTSGIQNVRKLENIMPKNYEIKHEEVIVGNDKIKKKILVNNRSYTVSGYGDYLGDKKYDNKFGDNNMFANKKILRIETNPLSKFELGMRIYGSKKNYYSKINKRQNSK